MITKIIFLLIFFGVMIGVGLYSRKHATNVNDFVLGGRAVGPWLTASVYNGLSRLFGMAFDIPYAACVIIMAVLTGVYVVLGGYMATAINDFIHGGG